MIQCVSGDFFEYEADIRINTVNCVGVMGAGVALEFKKRYPEMFRSYVAACKRNELAPGKPQLWEDYNLFSHCLIVNLPTKLHWRDPSKYEYIEKDLIWLQEFLMDRNATVTLPALGCGHGGLDWSIVKSQIIHYLGDVRSEILLFEPSSSNPKLEIPHLDFPEDSNITVLYPEHPNYPCTKSNSAVKELYCKGNASLLCQKKLSVLCSNFPSEREMTAIAQIAEEMIAQDCAIVLPLNNKQHLNLAIRLLSQSIKTILVLPSGILGFKHDIALEKYKGCYAVLSYTPLSQEFTRYSYINSLKFRSEIADAILYTSENLKDIQRDGKNLNRFPNLFYINYWSERRPEFSAINAKKVGIDPETKRPNVKLLLQCLNLCHSLIVGN